MRMRFFGHVVAWVAGPLMLGSAASALPPSVMEAYGVFSQAHAQGDTETALMAARQAVEAAEAEGIAAGAMGSLLENYAFYLTQTGDFTEAEARWVQAANLAAGQDGMIRNVVWRFYNAALVSLQLDDNEAGERAEAHLERAVEALESDSALANGDAELVGQVRYLQTRMAFAAGRPNRMLEPASQAIAAFEHSNRAPDQVYGLAHYYRGVAALYREQWADANYHMHLAGDVFAFVGQSREDASRAWALMNYAQLVGEGSAMRGVAERLESSSLHALLVDVETGTRPERPGLIPAVLQEQRAVRYPQMAASSGIEGIVVAQFDVSEDGQPENFEIVMEVPRGVFDTAVEGAISDWEFEPARLGGQTVREEGRVYHFTFKLR
ncbi:energy transducer TonB [Maricaulis sp. D1M11]|uniref:energy transducer TonB n=1 Tax=Maricaulis sp. D1M11 TaxID=3076117 RepID=UPI0039B49917